MKTKILVALLALLASAQPALAAYETGPANSVLRVPSGGGRPKYGAVDLSQSAAVTGILSEARGGSGNGSATNPNELNNVAISASVGSNALTLALKQSDGSTNCSSTAACRIGFRSSTATSGAYNVRSVTAALTLVVSSGSTLGHSSANAHYAYLYAIDNAGTVELAISSALYDDGTIVSTTAEGGAGAADSNAAIYSTTARSNVPVRLIGRLKSTQTTAGTWAAVPTEISLVPFKKLSVRARYYLGGAQNLLNNTLDIINYSTKVLDSHNAVTIGSGWKFTAPESGVYLVTGQFLLDSSVNPFVFYAEVYKNGSVQNGFCRKDKAVTSAEAGTMQCVLQIELVTGDYIDVRAHQNSGGTLALGASALGNRIEITKLTDL